MHNETLAQGTVPDDWRQANVAPIFKKGEKYDAANYRPVSLTCICCKTLEHIIVSNINKHLAFESILADCQHGFRSQRSCETQLVQFFHDLVSNLDCALFADDCVLYRNIESPTDCQILQDDLNSLAQWEADWQMKFNVAKCHSMRVTRHPPDKHIQFEYTLHQQRLEQVQSAKYLGITISDDLDWGQHISEISSKATKTLGFLRRNLAFAPRHTKEVAYKTLVRPKLEYAAPIWHPYHETQIGQVEKVQRTAARWTCRRWRNTSSVGDMLDDLEWPSLETRREQSSLTFFYKIHSGTVVKRISI